MVPSSTINDIHSGDSSIFDKGSVNEIKFYKSYLQSLHNVLILDIIINK